MGTHPIFESDFDCLTELLGQNGGSRNFVGGTISSIKNQPNAGFSSSSRRRRNDPGLVPQLRRQRADTNRFRSRQESHVPKRADRPNDRNGPDGINVPEEFGGAGMSALAYAVSCEEISR